MKTSAARKAVLVLGTVVALSGLAAPSATAAKSCNPVVNPYPGSRYDGVNLTGIRAKKVDCFTARKVAKRVHRKALGLQPASPLRFKWRRWRVTGYLSGSRDRYVARAGYRVVRWRF